MSLGYTIRNGRFYSNNKDSYPSDWHDIAAKIKDKAGRCCEACGVPNGLPPNMLTVHHLDYIKANCQDHNLIALCQRCHLVVQGWHFIPKSRTQVLRVLKARGKQSILPFV